MTFGFFLDIQKRFNEQQYIFMQISRDTPKNSQIFYTNIFKSILKQANISINEIPIIELIRRQAPVTQYPWATLANLENRIFTEYFCTNDTVTIKGGANTKFGSAIKIKSTCNISEHIVFSDEFHMRIPLYYRNEDTAVDCKISTTEFKVVFNHGFKQYGKMRIYLHEAFGFNRDTRDHNIKLGLTSIWNHIGSGHRIKVDQDRNFTLYNKFVAKSDKYRFGFVGVFELTKRFIAHKCFYLGYKHQKLEIHLKADQAFGRRTMNYKDIKQWFSLISATSIYELNSASKIAAQASFYPHSGKVIIDGLLQYISHRNKSQKSTVYKLKLDSLLTLNCLIRHKYNNKFTFSIGVKVPFYNKLQSNKVGMRIDVNM